jgi:hypothetical protein
MGARSATTILNDIPLRDYHSWNWPREDGKQIGVSVHARPLRKRGPGRPTFQMTSGSSGATLTKFSEQRAVPSRVNGRAGDASRRSASVARGPHLDPAKESCYSYTSQS